MSHDRFNDYLHQHNVTDATADRLSNDLGRLAKDAGLNAETLGGIVILAAQLVEASGVKPTTEESSERSAALEVLTKDPHVYHMIDYWQRGGVHAGHGIKHTRGIPPTEQVEKELYKPNAYAQDLKDTGMIAAWHHGKGIVGKIETPDYRAFYLDFQSPNAENKSRPTVNLYTTLPRDAAYDAVAETIVANPDILLEAFPAICPPDNRPDIRKLVEGVELVTPHVINLTPAWQRN